MKNAKLLTAVFLALVLSLNLVSALVINSVNTDTLTPGDEGVISIEVENILDDDVEEVSVQLKFNNLPFIPVGTSEKSVEEIDEGDEEDFLFRIKAANDVTPADYEIPYTLQYKLKDDSVVNVRSGTIGIRVTGSPDLVFSVTADNAVEKRSGEISFKRVNKGFTDARFVSVKILPDGFTLLSEQEVYIGTVDSDDFETSNFNVVFDSTNANFKAVLEYKDFDNNKVTKTIDLPVNVYSEERALELGIIKPNNSPQILAGLILVIVTFIVYRTIKKRRRLKRSAERR